MPKFTVMMIETLTHRPVVEAPTEAAAICAAETILTEADHNDDSLFGSVAMMPPKRRPPRMTPSPEEA
ncbi:hypothetical protein [Yoonia vestfoldensis]|jgi:hypothetical protein|uniref:hypothetical protein n=1 Tax=Yoonia vestfoldensis TaxID=245188 RepID=UPI000381FAC4|nr:hypothetical protein [Yoonia vestfoldensis]